VGQGEGEVGTPVGRDGDEEGQGGHGKAGSDPSEHALEVDVPIEDLAQLLGEDLELRKSNRAATTKSKASEGVMSASRTPAPNP
jgi:uncharacterized sporulation protein YeaH/YhbH (DUF444 family)